MQNKGAIRFVAIAFALVCLYQLSFTYVGGRVKKHAIEYARNGKAISEAKALAKGNQALETYYLDSISKARENYYLDSVENKPVFNMLIGKYTYKEVKDRELNLGLDLKGGMNVVLEVKVEDIIRTLAGSHANDPIFVKALNMATQMQKNSNQDYVTLFGDAFTKLDPNARLASIFLYEFKDKGITINSTNAQVLAVLNKETAGAVDRTFQILRTRIDRFGVAQPNIEKLATQGRILVELPGIKDPNRVRKLLEGTAKLQFWETYNFSDIHTYFDQANERLRAEEDLLDSNRMASNTTTTKTVKEGTKGKTVKQAVDTTGNALINKISKDTTQQMNQASMKQYAQQNPLYAYLHPSYYQGQDGQYYPGKGAEVGVAAIKDTARVNHLLSLVKDIFPRDLKLAWMESPNPKTPNYLSLVALKASSRDGSAALGGDVISDARQDYDQNGRVTVDLQMNSQGAKTWKRVTGDNIGKQVAIVLDGYVYSDPVVNDAIPNGRSSISGGDMTVENAKDLANILKAGRLPAPARIVEEAVVGPSLGREAVHAGMMSFILAFIAVLVYMIVYYNRAGWVASLALVVNVFFLFGVLASLGAVLTLPGIAGIVLTLGMAVDANVIIYERIKEEVRAGKGLRLALQDGYSNAYSAIIDGNVTTLLTGVVLYVFGTGPIQGFATTLIIGLLSSLFTAIFISRLIFERLLSKNKTISFSFKWTANTLSHTHIDFIGKRRIAYTFSLAIFIIGMISLFTRGLNFGVDFTGGRTYVVRFDHNVQTGPIRKALTVAFDNQAPTVKTFGPDNQIKIVTKYLIQSDKNDADSLIQDKLYEGLKVFYNKKISFKDFTSDTEGESKLLGILSSEKFGPTIAYDIREKAYFAIFFSLLIIFIYIAIRFKNWQFGLGGVTSLFHDTLITIGIFSLGYGRLPFGMEVGQSFIAAILTIIGYSINDTVIIFDRIRENIRLFPKHTLKQNMNDGMNQTLARTMNTSGTTLAVLVVIFLFGGEVIRGFTFALLMGILFGTYSSVFNATPIAYDLLHGDRQLREAESGEKPTNGKKKKK
ncbi:MAG: protein translocase subunit SecDF [Bacteroidales bacterium]|nr:protein translocase subunit SecDF [Bacteroidales bacterium]